MTIWFTSDTHYGHHNIIKHSGRPFGDIQEMEDVMVSRFNRVVSENDTVYHLGDFALDERHTKRVLPLLKGRHVLVSGNHDRCHAHHRLHEKWACVYESWGFSKVYREWLVEFDHGVWLSHMPTADHKDPRYPEYRPDPQSYQVLLHGHVHEVWKTKKNDCGSLMINVGVDQWDYRPVSWETLQDVIRTEGSS